MSDARKHVLTLLTVVLYEWGERFYTIGEIEEDVDTIMANVEASFSHKADYDNVMGALQWIKRNQEAK